MKISKLLVGFAALAALLSGAETLSRGDRDYAMSNLHAGRKMFLDAVTGLSLAQWNYKAGPDRWSIAECAEHILVTEELVTAGIREALKGKAEEEKRTPATEVRPKAEKLAAMLVDRSQKVQAPEAIRPTHRFASPEEIVAKFRELRDKNIEYVDTTEDDLGAHFMKHPIFGETDLYQWFILIAGHGQRHTLQILEVKADPGYPKK